MSGLRVKISLFIEICLFCSKNNSRKYIYRTVFFCNCQFLNIWFQSSLFISVRTKYLKIDTKKIHIQLRRKKLVWFRLRGCFFLFSYKVELSNFAWHGLRYLNCVRSFAVCIFVLSEFRIRTGRVILTVGASNVRLPALMRRTKGELLTGGCED